MLRFYHGKIIDCRVKTGVYILNDPAYWDGSKMVDNRRMADEERRYHNAQKEKIEKLCLHLQKEWQELGKNTPIAKDWLKIETDKFFHPEKYVVIEEEKKRRNLCCSERLLKHLLKVHPLVFKRMGITRGNLLVIAQYCNTIK